MGSRGRLLFDLNEPPAEDDEENDRVFCFQPQKALPSANPPTSELLVATAGPQRIINNHAFSHSPSVSGFQPFIRPKGARGHGEETEQNPKVASSSSKTSNGEDVKVAPSSLPVSKSAPVDEREEGEWSDAEGSADACASTILPEQGKASRGQGSSELMDFTSSGMDIRVRESSEDENSSRGLLGSDQDQGDQKSNRSRQSEGNAKSDKSMDGQEEPGLVPKQREVKGAEGSLTTKCANNPGKRKIDQQKEAMLGKKRHRQTVFLNLEDVKQAGSMKTSTPRRQNPPIITRTVKEVRTIHPPAERVGEKQNQSSNKDMKQYDASSCNEGGTSLEAVEPKSECNGDINSGLPGRPRRLNSGADFSTEASQPPIPRQSSWKQPADARQLKNSQFANKKPALVGQISTDSKLGNKKHPPAKKPTATGNSYQDTSVERLIREVTNEKFWHHPGNCKLINFCSTFD